MRKSQKTLRALIWATALTGVATGAHAGSFALKERSTKAQGASFAGATAGSGGLSSMGFNPAAIGLVPDGQGNGMLAGGLSYILPSAEGVVSDGTTVDPARDAGLANGYIGYRLEDDILIGASLYTPFGLTTQLDAGWLGQGDALTSKLQSFTLAPTVAWEPIPELTVAFALNIFYSNIRLTTGAVPGLTAGTQLDGDSMNLGFSVGALWDATDSTTIGIAYQHGYELDVEGRLTLNGVPGGPFPANARSALPAVASVGIVQGITDDLRVTGEFQWQDWSVFERIDLTSVVSQQDIQNYEDAFYVAGGIEYDLLPELTLRTGAAWDQTPTTADPIGAAGNPGATARTARVPDEDRVWLSIGASYDVNDHMTLDFAYSYLFTLDDPVVGLRTAPGATVTYDGQVHIFSVGSSLNF